MIHDLLSRLPLSPDVYLHKMDFAREAGLLVQLDLNAYRAASFLDDRILTPATKGAWTPLTQVIDAARNVRQSRPLHFIFHSGHVGSTLLSRLLDETGVVLPLREPLPLRSLAEAHDMLGQADSLTSPAQFESLQCALMQVWSRGYDASRAVILKATSSTARAAPALLSGSPASKIVYLNVRPEPYLATLLGGRNASIDLRGHGPVRIRGLQSRLSGPLAPLHTLSVGELAAMSWLAEAWNQADLVGIAGDRVLSLDFEQFLTSVQHSMERVLAHLELPRDASFLNAVASSPVLSRYSKAAEFEYSPETRARVLAESRRKNSVEIRRGLEWLDGVARSDGSAAQILNAPN